MKKVLVIATYDSFLKVAMNISRRISNSIIDVSILKVKKNQISNKQLYESGANNYNFVSYQSVSELHQYDIIVLSIGNIAFRKFITEYYSYYDFFDKDRPIILAIFSGVIFGEPDTILSRINSDIILANNIEDQNIILETAKLYRSPVKVLNYGLININTDYQNLYSERFHEKETLVFIEQVKIPCSQKERCYVLDKLIEIAQNNPDKNIILKVRVLPGEKTVHSSQFSYVSLLKDKLLPSNFTLSSEPVEELYKRMDLCITFSSTVVFEALYYGIPCAIIKDLGIRSDLANRAFLNSGLFLSFDEINLGKRKRVEFSWLDKNINFDSDRDLMLNETIDSLLEDQRTDLLLFSTLFGGGFRFKRKSSIKRKFFKFLFHPKLFFIDSKLWMGIKALYGKK
ncbi:hypothetical protein EV697_101408 [Bisgaardia hudsonensis]|uniref:Uncharacterized protein n=1 Tax=Bisgaardia hudsonensis TaxID=109472 RepID=A0A4R2N365_9PAST|nr:DUF6716 putative glycosyltransferase [Bisgaardia hudsonensis]QLB12719.1 hypothetical protein A6A11_03415 [Bisgaardia hudsonensis]TCP14269.1 hypothetical protein EV697_101408 [Bisgaardia hudsonensis]